MSLSWEEKMVLRGGETSMFTDIDVFGEKYRCFIDVLNKKISRFFCVFKLYFNL